MNLEELGRRIRTLREQRGLKQRDLAGALQVSPQSVSKWERGENAPDLATIGPLAGLLGVTTDWLLGCPGKAADALEATVFVSSVDGAYARSLTLSPADFAAWANGFFHQLTEAILRHDGVPIKYMGDQFLAFFSGQDHARRALEAARLARRICNESLRIGLSTGSVYVGSVGHPDYARPDIMGETVNVAFLTMGWAETNAESGLAATLAVVRSAGCESRVGRGEQANFKGIDHPVEIREITEEANGAT